MVLIEMLYRLSVVFSLFVSMDWVVWGYWTVC